MRRHQSRGFTLLEVILALALSVSILIAIGAAIDVHLRLLDSGRTQVEEGQLARAVLRLIADDLRGAVSCDPVDTEELVPDVSAAAEEAGVEEEEINRATDLVESSAVQSQPGLYGNNSQLQVDTSRLPRIDQFNGTISPDDPEQTVGRPSDVKTVCYYVSSDGENTGGLVRRETDRATAAWAAERGELVHQQQGPIAPEVAAIEFRYFDGTEWHEEWDCQEQGGLPMAVDVALGVIPTHRRDPEAELTEDELLVYRLMVHLPTARPTTADTQEESQ